MKQKTGPKRKRNPRKHRQGTTGALNVRQAAFVREYLVDLNATQAAIRAGYSEAGASVTASKLLALPKIDTAVSAAMAKRAQRVEVKADDVLRELAAIAFSDVTEIVSGGAGAVLCVEDLKSLPVQVRRCIESVSETQTAEGGATLKVKLHSKVAALKMLMDHLGMNAPVKVDAHVTQAEASPEEALEQLKLAAQRDPKIRAALGGGQ